MRYAISYMNDFDRDNSICDFDNDDWWKTFRFWFHHFLFHRCKIVHNFHVRIICCHGICQGAWEVSRSRRKELSLCNIDYLFHEASSFKQSIKTHYTFHDDKIIPSHLIYVITFDSINLISHLWLKYISTFFSFETIQLCVLFCRNFEIRILNCEYDREIIHEIDWNFEQILFHESIIHLFISKRVFFEFFRMTKSEKKKKKFSKWQFSKSKKKIWFFTIFRFFFSFFVFRFFFFSTFFEFQVRFWIFSDIVISVF